MNFKLDSCHITTLVKTVLLDLRSLRTSNLAYKTNALKQLCSRNKLIWLLQLTNMWPQAIIILINPFAVFYRISHSILLHQLQELGIRNFALEWFKSYLGQCRWYGIINETHYIKFCVSVCLQDQCLYHCIQEHQWNLHLYADDTQLYMACFKPNNIQNHYTRSLATFITVPTSIPGWWPTC